MPKGKSAVKLLENRQTALYSRGMRAGTFTAIVLGIVLASYAALLFIAASPLYCAHSAIFSDTAICYKSNVTGQTAETLIVGDSSLLYGVKPAIVAARGGGSIYNLGTVGPSFGYDPSGLIDGYLARNMRPKAIILYFAPWHSLTSDHVVDPQWFPLALSLLQRGQVEGFLHFLSLRPSAIVELPPTVLANLNLDTAAAARRRDAMTRDGGYLDYAALGFPALEGCKPGSLKAPPYPIAADNRVAIQTLKARYRAKGIPVYVMIAPWATCDGHREDIVRAYAGVADMEPAPMRDRLFAADTPLANHVHASREGVASFSSRVADFIRVQIAPTP